MLYLEVKPEKSKASALEKMIPKEGTMLFYKLHIRYDYVI